MGLFSFFKRKNEQAGDAPVRQHEALTGVAGPGAARPDTARPDVARPDVARPDAARPDAARPDVARPDVARPDVARPDAARPDAEADRARQREIARATAAKIDEIELAMTSDIFDDAPEWGKVARRPAAAAPLPTPEPGATELLADEPLPDVAAPANAPVVEESAILYADGQLDAAEQMLRDCLAELGREERQPWWMLFDLYQASGREHAFESIAIDYASHFETSPPAYTPLATAGAAPRPFTGVTPALAFSGVLDESAVAPLQGLLLPAGASPLVRLDFGAVRGATEQACARLLSALQALRGAGRELVLDGADQLLAVLRPMLAIGERDTSQAPWLLLLELLLLTNREKDFEETAMDYCITFEVSPPSFEAPPRASAGAGAAAVAEQRIAPDAGRLDGGHRFMLPGLVAGDCRALLAAIDDYAGRYDPVVLDCSRLARIDYAAANALHAQLRRLAAGGRRLELREVNHLIAALFRLLGVADDARVFAHKY